MKKKWFFIVPPLIVLFIAIGTEVVMHLWNWLTPALFGWRLITFWQALGLLVLCRILFGGHGGHGFGGHGFRRRMHERWERMTPEEREKFRQSWRGRCGGFGEPTGGTGAPA
jgi:hypothetical protein